MPIARVAIVGRPNAGKSSLLNMIAGAKVSIVDPTPGVTRDRVCAIVELPAPDNQGEPKPVEFVDTGGYGVYVVQGERYDEVGADLARLTHDIEAQIARAVESADLILFAVDAQQGVTAHDEEIARLLRRRGIGQERRRGAPKGRGVGGPATLPPVRVVATKVDGPKWESHAAELSALGFGEALMCSSKSNYFRRELVDSLYALVPHAGPGDARGARADMMLAIVGKRNSGKSTLVNTMAGEERMIVSEIAGTTRDAVDIRMEIGGKSLVAIDTAGLRRRSSFQNAIEIYAFDRMQRAMDRGDVVVLLLDATATISQVDEKLAQLAQKAYKPVVVAVNKWDVVEGTRDERGKPVTPERYEAYIRRELRGLWFAPIIFLEARTGRHVRALIDLAFDLKAQGEARVTTGKLNRLVRAIVERQGPTDTKGTQAKVYFVAQTGVSPPTITLVVNHPELFRPNYLRFLLNRFREELPFEEVPVRIVVRARRQREDDLAGGDDVRVRRGRKGVDVRARERVRQQGEALPSDEAVLAEFDGAGVSDEELIARYIGEDSSEVDTGYDRAVEMGDFEGGTGEPGRDDGGWDDGEEPESPAASARGEPQAPRTRPSKKSAAPRPRGPASAGKAAKGPGAKKGGKGPGGGVRGGRGPSR